MYPSNVTSYDGWWCREWRVAHHFVYQLGNLFLAAAFIIPDDYRHHTKLFRVTLCVGCACLAVWGAAVTCRVDVIAWYSVFVAVNSFQLVLLAFSSCGGGGDAQLAVQPACLADVYARVFKPMSVTRRQFVELISTAWIDDFVAGTSIMLENASPIGDRLSLLLSGRLRVTNSGVCLHSIQPHQFVNSVEFDSAVHSQDTCQVSVTAEQNSRLVTWDSSHLRQYLASDLHLSTVFDLVIGNDIASKLYSIKCRPRHAAAAAPSVRVPATRSLPLQLNVGDSHRSVRGVRAHPDRPEQLPLKLRLPSFVGSPNETNGRQREVTAATPIGPYSPSQLSYETFV